MIGKGSGWFSTGHPAKQKGAMGYVFAWLLGVPIPILILVFLLRGCT